MLVYGGARDLAGYRQMGLPLYCIGSATRDKPADFSIVGYNVPVDLGGVIVKPGDIIVADEDGVVAIPSDALDKLLANLTIIFEVEAGMEQALAQGASVDELAAITAKKQGKK